jgi:hypothetical protein
MVKLSWSQIRRVVKVQVGLAGSQRYIFYNIKMTREAASADTLAFIYYIG